MAIETKKELNVDIDLNTKAIKEQTQIIVQSFQEIGKQIQDLSNIIKGIGTSSKSLDNVNNTTKKISQNTEETKRKTDSANKSTVSWFKSLSKIGLTIAGFRRLGQTIGELVKESGSWIENLNLFEVTFGDTYKKSLDWSIEFAENLGFSVNEMVKFTGLFKQLSTSIGIAQETGDKLAETLTSIGTDITSFYNLSDVQTAMEKLQAGIFSGQTKPLRSIGIDVTYQSIDNLLKTNEALAQFNTTSKKLDQSQKALARTILVLQGARNAFGDTQKTINSLSNQIRVFQGSLQNLKLALGDTFAEPFRKALVFVNGVIIALTDIIRLFFELKTTTGNPLPDGTIISQINDELDEYEKKQGLLSFDKFNIASSDSSTNDLSITEALTEELNNQIEQYEQIKQSMGDIHNEAVQIAQTIKDWFIITDADNKFVGLTSQAKGLAIALTTITLIPIVVYLQKALKSTTDLTAGMKLLQKVFTPLGLTITAIVAVLAYIYITNEEFRNSVNDLVKALLSLISTALSPFVKILNLIMPIFTKLIDVVAKILTFIVKIITKIVEFIEKLHILDGLIYVVIGAFTLLGAVLGTIGIINLIKNIGTLIAKLKSLGTALIGFGKNISKFMISPTGIAIAGIALLAINIGLLVHSWDNMSSWQKAVGIIGAVAGAILLVVSAIAAFHGSWSMGTAIAAIVAGLVAVGSAIAVFWSNAKKEASSTLDFSGAFADGGIPRTGSLFIAGESGAEFVTNMGNNQTGVTNIQQFKMATLEALLEYNRIIGNDSNNRVAIDINVSPREMARVINPYIKTENARGGNR